MSNAWLGGENQDYGSRQREVRWLTPHYIVDALGWFDLDPCGAPGHELAAKTYLPENDENGLALPWEGRVWLNPPYGKLAEPFLVKMAEHGNGTALIFARTETQVFKRTVWQAATGLLFLEGRLNFLDASGIRAKANAGAPSVLVAYGEADYRVLETTRLMGKAVRL